LSSGRTSGSGLSSRSAEMKSLPGETTSTCGGSSVPRPPIKLRSAKGPFGGLKILGVPQALAWPPTETGNGQQCRRRKGLMRNTGE
jgi:hypothetical protein